MLKHGLARPPQYGLTATILSITLLLTSSASLQATPPPPPPGLIAVQGGLYLAGKPYRGIGANYFNLFARVLRDPADATWQPNLKRLADSGVPFVRFMACGFWPADCDLYFKDKAAYFARLDQVVRAAEADHIGLIPSLFWHPATVPDLAHEPLDQLGNPQSKTIAFIRQYTAEVVERYKNSPAIWGWEFGNEYNLGADLPNAAEHRPPVVPKLKTALKRTERDELKSAEVITAFTEFASEVRRHDSTRIILTGNSIPRPSAWHNTAEKSWTPDTPEQFGEMLLRDNPVPLGTLTVHIYPKEGKTPYPAACRTLAELIAKTQSIARIAGRPLFIGEFGVPRQLGAEEGKKLFQEMLDAIVADDVPLAAFWVYDLSQQDQDWNVTFANDRAWIIEAVAAANRKLGNKQ